MADFKAIQRVRLNDGTNDRGLVAGQAIFVKITDGTDTLLIDGSGNVGVTGTVTIQDGGGSITVDGTVAVSSVGGTVTVSASDLDIRDLSHTTDSVKIGDGTDFLAIDGSGYITSNINGSVTIVDGGGSITVDGTVSISGTVTVSATNLDIRDLTSASDSVEVLQSTHDDLNANANLQVGNTDVGPANPVPVTFASAVVTGEVQNYDTASSVASDASDTHTYTVTALKTLLLKQVIASASSEMKIEIKVGPTGSTVTKAVVFTSATNLIANIQFEQPIEVAAGDDVEVVRTNRDNQAMDVYSTIIGIEV